MPDFSPDTSIYRPQNQMDTGSMLGLVQTLRNLQTQNAVSDALRQSGGDPNSALTSLMKPGAPGIATAGMVTDLAQAAKAKADLQQHYFTRMGNVASSVLGSGMPLTDDVMHGLGVQMVRSGVPANVVTQWINDLPPDPKARQFIVTQLTNLNRGGEVPPQSSFPTGPGGKPEVLTGQEQYYRFYGGAKGGQQSPFAATPGGRPGGLPVAAEAPLTQAAAVSAKVTDPQFIPSQYNILGTLGALSHEAATGPSADFETRLNQFGQRIGVNITQNAKDLAKTEEFGKLAEQLVQQSPAFGQSDAFLRNAYGANPNLHLSKLGREGIIHWLEGNVDAQKSMVDEWQRWLDMPGHEGLDNQFQKWLRSKTMKDGSPGFDATNFDPRVFQYLRLPTRGVDDDGNVINPREQFRTMFKDQNVLRKHIEEYRQRGLING